MPPRKYPPILPAAPVLREGVSSPSSSRNPTKDLARKRVGTQIACTECRSRKIRCDGGRPMCSNCVKRALTTCIYAEKREAANNPSMEALELLRTLPEDRAFDLLTALRSKNDPTTVLSIFKGGTEELSAQLPPPGLLVDTGGAHQNFLEEELMAKNSNTYPALRPILASILAQSNLLRPVQGTIPLNQQIVPDNIGQVQLGISGVHRSDAPPVDADSAIRQFRLLTKPSQHPEYCDERLHNLDVTFWTNVEVTSDFVARVLSLYIKTDHPLLGLFDPQLFITDLVDQKERFCSKLLFHALMYLGCQMYSAFHKGAIRAADKFCEQAERIWEFEKDNDSYTNMAGAVILSLSLMGHGKDHAVLLYTTAAARMGTRLGLFGVNEDIAVRIDEDMSEEERSASCYAAWGVFNWSVLMSLFYRQPGSDSPYSPPVLPIPGEAAFLTQTFDSSIESLSAIGVLMGNTFPALCQFWRIIHGARWIYYPDHKTPAEHHKLDLAEHKFRELIAWAEGLPPSMIRTEGSPHHVAVFHIWLHAAILDILRPFIGRPLDQRPRLKTFLGTECFADDAYSASVSQLKRLIVDYRTNYETSAYSILWHTGLMYLANAMLQDTNDPEWRLYFLLCIYGYEILRRPYRISEVIVQGLLAMTLRDTNMSGDEARQIMKELEERGLDHVKKDVEEKIRATFMVDLNLALTDPDKAMVENMAGEFNNLALFQEYLHHDQMER